MDSALSLLVVESTESNKTIMESESYTLILYLFANASLYKKGWSLSLLKTTYY